MTILRSIIRKIKESRYTKYIVTLCVIILVVGFVDDNSILNRQERISEIKKLQREIAVLRTKYEEDTRKLRSLDEYENIVRIAREKYLMKRPDEDIFVISSQH